MDNAREAEASLTDKVLALCDGALSQDDAELTALAEQIKQQLKGKSLPQLARAAPRVGHRHYDRLIETLFSITTTGIPREVFLQEVMKLLDQQAPDHSHSIRLIIEADRPRSGEAYQYRGFYASGLQLNRWQNFRDKALPGSADSRLFERLLFGNQTLEVMHSDFLDDYAGEFSSLIDKQNPFWINAVPLPATASHYPNRCLIVLYPVKPAQSEKLFIPSNTAQEWRVLHFTSIAYQHLSHQLAGLAEQIGARRTEMLAELAPGILHHEMGHWLHLMRTNLKHQINVVSQLLADYEHPLLDELFTDNQALYENAARLYATLDTFNNLEQRYGREQVSLRDLFQQLQTMCHHRLGPAGVQLLYHESAAFELLTDAALLLHLMLNIVINAINAIHEDPDYIPHKTVLLRAQRQDPNSLQLDFLNNGPPLAAAIRDRLFQRGVTSRSQGLGQGLYISAMIARYLGGQLSLLDVDDLKPDQAMTGDLPAFQIGFRLTLPFTLPDYQDLDSERRQRKF